MYAIVETGGKQYRVSEGDTIQIEKLPGEVGDTVELDRVLMVSDGKKVTVGRPLVKGAKVVATITEHTKGPKIRIFKYTPSTRYRLRKGHRQHYTMVQIGKIKKK